MLINGEGYKLAATPITLYIGETKELSIEVVEASKEKKLLEPKISGGTSNPLPRFTKTKPININKKGSYIQTVSAEKAGAGVNEVYLVGGGHILNNIITVLEPKIEVTANKQAINIGEDVTFTATLTPSNESGKVSWTGGNNPAKGKGLTFTTNYDTAGAKTVEATWTFKEKKYTDSITITVLEPIITITADKEFICIKENVTFTAVLTPANKGGEVSWIGGNSPARGKGLTFTTNYDTSGKKTVTATWYFEGNEYTATKDVTVVKVELTPDPVNVPFEKTNTATATISPATACDQISFIVDDDSLVSVSPTTATASPQTLTLTGKSGKTGTTKLKAKLKNASASAECASVMVNVIKMDISELGFKNDHLITKWPSKSIIDDPDGSQPVWKKIGNPNDPVCYTKNTAPTMFAKFDVSPSSINVSNVQVRAKVGSTVIGVASSITINGTTIDVPNVSGGSVIPNSDGVKKLQPSINWEFSFDSGTTWVLTGTSTITLYFTVATPKETPLYDLALEKATGYVNGDVDICGKVCSGISSEVYYDPREYVTGHPLRVYMKNCALCMNHAQLMECLVKSVGIDASVLYLWGGCNANTVDYYLPHGGSFRVIKPANDKATANPHFTYHAMTQVGGALYDPSYGTTGSTTLDETAPGGGVAYIDERGVLYTEEDLNGNGILDAGEDLNGNGILDLHLNEDANKNGVLDAGEDLNRNGVLDVDFSEDRNGNGVLDSPEDVNGNGILDHGHQHAASAQTGVSWPPLNKHIVNWNCPH